MLRGLLAGRGRPELRLAAICTFGTFGVLAALAASSAGCGGSSQEPAATPSVPLTAAPADGLRPPEAFAGISDREDRSRALFAEAGRVLLHPRCVNCHPAGDSPHQRDAMLLHDPPVTRGPADQGVVGMACGSCHQDKNPELARVPGAPNWHLAPKSMAWEGRSLGAICEQVKDRARNGGKSLQAIADHAAHDPLVAWGWAPGADRAPAPGSQAKFGALVSAWIETGAVCPKEEATR
ncbi:Isoquinoline 1-oxidoreductase subunit [Pendulispora albinea]|uniref:Isoquinoline 1-oxidoreductase subunit n=1 Tax=Pendulispora albinea TaxID=2741071 RepID=A0ABZ2M9P7_9BACT